MNKEALLHSCDMMLRIAERSGLGENAIRDIQQSLINNKHHSLKTSQNNLVACRREMQVNAITHLEMLDKLTSTISHHERIVTEAQAKLDSRYEHHEMLLEEYEVLINLNHIGASVASPRIMESEL